MLASPRRRCFTGIELHEVHRYVPERSRRLRRGGYKGLLRAWDQSNAQQNITVFHLNPAAYGSAPVDMDTADARGDLFFMLDTAYNPVECDGDRDMASRTAFLDCKNAEQNDPHLVVTKLTLEVDDRYGKYSMCNVCIDGKDPLGHGRGQGCSMTGGPGGAPEYVCECQGDCKRWEIGWESVAEFFKRLKPRSSTPSVDWWRYNAAQKLGGSWYSTLAQGQCKPTSNWCGWRVVKTDKRVSKACADESIFSYIESKSKSTCFDTCKKGQGRFKDPCWVKCLFDAVLGSGAEKGEVDTTGGMSLEDLDAAWARPFDFDEAQGGCAALDEQESGATVLLS